MLGDTFSALLPLPHNLLLDAQVLKHPRHHGIYYVVYRLRIMVERRNGGQHRRARFGDRYHVAQVNQTEWGFAGDQNQLAALFQADIGGAGDSDRRRSPGGDPAEGAHRAGNDCHAVVAVRAAGGRGVVVLRTEEPDAWVRRA